MNDGPEWFAAKRYGYGAGLPIAWQGWAILIAFLLLIAVALWLFGADDPRGLAIVVPATVVLILVAARTTRGGWRWRWGED